MRAVARSREPLIGQGDASCSFCGGPPHPLKFIGGPGGIYICGNCVGLAGDVLATRAAATTPIATLAAIPARQASACSFCGKPRDRVRGLAATGQVSICDECLDLCEEILTDT